MKKQLQKVIEEMEVIQGKWNGDEPGYYEEQANIASDISEKAHQLINLINELNGTN